MNIGFLSPRSDAHPAIGLDFTAGLKWYLKEKQIDAGVRLFAESIGFGGSEKEVYEKAEKLLMIDDVDILLAFVDERVMDILKPLLYASGKLMIVINAGANYPINWVPQENIIYLTLQHAFCTWLTGIAAAGQPGKDAATATSFYDCGYLHIASGVKAFTNSGGNIVFNFVNNDKKYDENFTVAPLTTFLSENNNCNNILCTFDSLPASLFYDRIAKETPGRGLHLFVSPMMLEPGALTKLPAGFPFSVTGHTPRPAGPGNDANDLFMNTCAANKKTAGCFSLLGWETGMIIENILQQGEDVLTNGVVLAEEIKKKKFSSPRGELALDRDTHFFLAPVWKCSIAPGAAEMEISSAKSMEAEWKDFISEPTTGVVSGWTNTYLCY